MPKQKQRLASESAKEERMPRRAEVSGEQSEAMELPAPITRGRSFGRSCWTSRAGYGLERRSMRLPRRRRW